MHLDLRPRVCRAVAVLALLIAPPVLIGQAAPGRTAADGILAMTFNIRYGTAKDGLDRWPLRAHRVLARIRATDPDLLGVQEALHFQVQQLEQALPDYLSFGTHRRGGTEDESCRVFVRAARFAVEDSGTFWLSPTPDVVGSRGWDAALPRICTWAVLRDRRTHSRLLLANTHFDHRGQAARLASAQLLQAWSGIFRLPVLLMGDFNSGEDTAAMRHLRDHGLRDSFRVVHPAAAQVGTFNGFRTRGEAKIDHVFVSAEFTVTAATIDASRVDGRFPSDHLPVTATVQLPPAAAPRLVPALSGKPWHIGDNPDLGALQGARQEVVDHAIFQSEDGAWHLWACVRGTRVGRVLYAWEGAALTQRHWRRVGIAMRASPAHGESIADWGGQEWIQAPHVIRHAGAFHMLYGGHRSELEHCQICLATSADGRHFARHRNALGQSRVFVGPGEARDPMTLRIGDTFHCYYTGNPDPRNRRDQGAIYCRTSPDLTQWSEPRRVCFGGVAGKGMWSAECPHVVWREGYYYLFRTTNYRKPETHVYRSQDPLDFGLDDDSKHIGTLAVAAPEVVRSQGRDYISSVHDLTGGVQLMRLDWQPAPK